VDDGPGAKFWFGMVGVVVACGVGAFLLFFLIGAAWYRWGAIGTLLVFSAVLLLWAWIYDRRKKKQWAELADE
jgi:hypothetical protein